MFNAKLFHAASLFVSADKTRYNLKGVRIEPDTKNGGSWYVATDGHCLFAAHDQQPFETDSGEHVLQLDGKIKTGFSKHDRGTFTASGNQYILTGSGQSVVAVDMQDDCTFPDWRRVTSGVEFAEPSVKNLGFNVDYLAKFAKAREILTGKKGRGLTPSRTNSGPAYISLTDDTGWLCFGLIMPMRKQHAPTAPHPDFAAQFIIEDEKAA